MHSSFYGRCSWVCPYTTLRRIYTNIPFIVTWIFTALLTFSCKSKINKLLTKARQLDDNFKRILCISNAGNCDLVILGVFSSSGPKPCNFSIDWLVVTSSKFLDFSEADFPVFFVFWVVFVKILRIPMNFKAFWAGPSLARVHLPMHFIDFLEFIEFP